MSDDRPNVYVEDDGTVVYRSSATGNCIRGLVAARMGLPPEPHPDWLLAKFAEGNTGEPVIVQKVKELEVFKFLDPNDLTSYAGLPTSVLRDCHDGQFTMQIPIAANGIKGITEGPVVLRGHMDGIVQVYARPADFPYPLGQKLVMEAKAFGKTFVEKYKREGILAFPYYAQQVTNYMRATGLPCMFVVGEKDAEGNVVRLLPIEYFNEPPVPFGNVKGKILRVEYLAARGDLTVTCPLPIQYPCQYYQLHDEVETNEDAWGQTQTPIADELLDSLAERYLEASRAESDAKKAKKAAGDGIKAFFDGLPTKPPDGKVITERYIIEDYTNTVPPSTEPRAGYEMRYPKIKPVDTKEGTKRAVTSDN